MRANTIGEEWRALSAEEIQATPDGYITPYRCPHTGEDGYIVSMSTKRARSIYRQVTTHEACNPHFLRARYLADFLLSCDELSLWFKVLG